MLIMTPSTVKKNLIEGTYRAHSCMTCQHLIFALKDTNESACLLYYTPFTLEAVHPAFIIFSQWRDRI